MTSLINNHCRLENGQTEVSDLTPGYGAITDTNRSIPVAQTRTRKYSESVGRSYVASAVARLIANIPNIVNTCPLLQINVHRKTLGICCSWYWS